MSKNNNKPTAKGKAAARRRKLSPKAMALLPYPAFALSPHIASGRWYKVHNGKRYYFGKLTDGWEAAYKRYEDEWPQIVTGRKPRPHVDEQDGGGLTLRAGVNKWLAARVEDGQYGNIAASTVDAYRSIGTRLVEELGGTTRIGTTRTKAAKPT